MMDVKWLFLLLVIKEVYCGTDTLDLDTNKKYCGTLLADVLSLVCKGRYNTLFDLTNNRNKRNVEMEFPFTSKKNSISLLRNRRLKRGVYNECCVKGCAFTELRAYCAPDKKNN